MAGVDVRPVTPSRWKDLERFFAPNGMTRTCWCMWWRMPSKDFDKAPPAGKRSGLRELVRGRRTPGLLAYRDGDPVGWVSVAPREEFGRLERSPTLKRVDDKPVWSIVCFYIDRKHRGEGVARALLDAAVDHAAGRGAKIVEGYPVDQTVRDYPAAEAYTGSLSLFESAGFKEVARQGKRPVVRRAVRRRAS